MNATIHLCGPTVKQLEHLLRVAFQGGDLRVIKRVSALVLLGDGHRVEEEFAMSYITSFEEFGIAQGRRQEIKRSIHRTLQVRFGTDAAETVIPRLSRLSLNQLDTLAETALVATSFDTVVTTVTELEVEQGCIEGLIDGLTLALEMKFGEVSPLLLDAIRRLTDRTVIEAIMTQVKMAQTLDDVWRALTSLGD